MQIFTKALMIAVLMSGFPMAYAETQTGATATITVSYDTGMVTHSTGSGGFKNLWTSTQTEPQLTLSTTVNNIKNGTTGPLLIYPGSSAPYTIVLSSPTAGWKISGYTFTISGTSGKQLTHNGTTTEITTTPQTITESGLHESTHTMSYTGGNTEASFSDFTVSLVFDPNDPELEVDEAPAEDAGSVMAPTTIVGDRFNIFTTWYHILDNKDFLTGATASTAGADATDAYTDGYLYCVVKDGASYSLYNKAAGVAVPVAGAVVSADKLMLDGREVTPRFAQKFVAVKVEDGTFTRDGATSTNKWQNLWTSDAGPVVTFSGNKNNMTTTGSASGNTFVATGDFQLESGSNGAAGNFTWVFSATGGNYVADFTFLGSKTSAFAEDCKVTPNGGSQVALNEYQTRITGRGYNDTRTAGFVQNSINGKGMIMSDAYVTVRRMLTLFCDRVGYNVFPRSNIERRIPALARVYKGDNAGRLVAIYDYRHNGGDIGMAGNISLQISVSDDNGATWSEPDYCRNADGRAVTTFNDSIPVSKHNLAYYQQDPNLYWDFAFGDAAIVADRESGKLLLMAVGGPTLFWGGRYDKPNQCVRWYSEDGGQTWSEPVRVTYDILDLFNGEPQFGKIDSQFIGSGKIMQSRYIKEGDYYRVYAVIASQNNGNQGTTRNYVLYSDDFGETWAVLGGTDQCPVATGDGDECKTEELPDGSVLLAGRRRTGNRNFNIFRYTDIKNGQGKWLDQVVTDMGFGSINACDGEILIVPATDNINNKPCYLALQSFPFGGGREYVSIAYKSLASGSDILDARSFTSWENRYRVSDRSSCYSTMTWQADNKLGFFFEETRNGTYDGMYLNFSLEEISDGAYSYREESDQALADAMRDQLVDLRAEAFSAERNGYVGEIIDTTAFEDALKAYKDNPCLETYLAFNQAEYFPETEEIADGGIYQFVSAHNGTYTGSANGVDFTQPIYLAATSEKMIATNDNSGRAHLFKVQRAESGNWILLNEALRVYAPASPSTSSEFGVSVEPAGYLISSSKDGKSNMSSAVPASPGYASIHLDRSAAIVAWTSTSAASQWHMQLVEAPGQDAIENIESGREVVAESYFDLQGRRVVRPGRGLYITNRGRKVLL